MIFSIFVHLRAVCEGTRWLDELREFFPMVENFGRNFFSYCNDSFDVVFFLRLWRPVNLGSFENLILTIFFNEFFKNALRLP